MIRLTRNPHDATPAPKQTRKGTTAMEYLMMLSLIIVVALVGVGYFGTATNNVTKAASDAISKSVKKSS